MVIRVIKVTRVEKILLSSTRKWKNNQNIRDVSVIKIFRAVRCFHKKFVSL